MVTQKQSHFTDTQQVGNVFAYCTYPRARFPSSAPAATIVGAVDPTHKYGRLRA